jgi:hypothetical protein
LNVYSVSGIEHALLQEEVEVAVPTSQVRTLRQRILLKCKQIINGRDKIKTLVDLTFTSTALAIKDTHTQTHTWAHRRRKP